MGANLFLENLKKLVGYGEGEGKWDMGELGQMAMENRPRIGFGWGNPQMVAAMAQQSGQDRELRMKQKLLGEQEKKANRYSLAGVTVGGYISQLSPELQPKAWQSFATGEPSGDKELDAGIAGITQKIASLGNGPEDRGSILKVAQDWQEKVNKNKQDLEPVYNKSLNRYEYISKKPGPLGEGMIPTSEYTAPKSETERMADIAQHKQEALDTAKIGAQFRESKEPPPSENWILPDKTNAISYDRGRSYQGSDGKSYKMPSNAIKVPGGATLGEIGAEAGRKQATEQLGGIGGGLEPVISPEEATKGKSFFQAGVGPYSMVQAAVNKVAGGAGVDKIFGKEGFYNETEDNRQQLRLLRNEVYGAFKQSDRGSEWDQKRVNAFTPDPGSFWSNPATEARKFDKLRNALVTEKKYNLLAITRARTPKRIEDLEIANEKIDRLMIVLGTGKQDILNSKEQSLINKYLPKGKK